MTKLLLPPGIGDIHWCMLKMQSFIREKLYGRTPEVWIVTMLDGKERAGDYIKKVPFVKFGGYYDMTRWKRQAHECFTRGAVFEDFRGFDYFYSYNTVVEKGNPIASWWPVECEPDYKYPLVWSPKEQETTRFWQKDGPYILLSFYQHGWYQTWWDRFPPQRIIKALRRILPKHRLVITGASWDVGTAHLLEEEFEDVINMAGQTTIDELFGLIRGCDAYVGHAAGNAMMAVHLRRPTVMLWHPDTFNQDMWQCWVDPYNDNYRPWDVRHSTATALANQVKEFVR